MSKKIKIKFQNGINFKIATKEILSELTDEYVFVESENPDFILFGPYGNDIPLPGNYIRIGYFCENVKPDLTICEWAFGIPREKEVHDPRYKRIQWHNLNPQCLIKPGAIDLDHLFNSKTKFCNFLYGHQVPYREKFFKELSKYKKVDAPGVSMNNMDSIDDFFKGDIWERKKQFLAPYKFTIAFENYSYPGYQTEKFYHAMESNSIPIYCGDPFIGEIFNTKSFINTFDLPNPRYGSWIQLLEKKAQPNFVDTRPQFYKSPATRISRKLKSLGREIKMNLQLNNLTYKKLVDRIVEINEDKNLYKQMILEPWLKNNALPVDASLKSRWIEIFK